MSNTSAAIVLVLGALLLAGCPDDETVDPVPPQDASASNEATTSDASSDAASTDGASDSSDNDAADE